MPSTLATLIVAPEAPRIRAGVSSATQEQAQDSAQERERQEWAYAWALLTGWDLPAVPDWLGTSRGSGPAATTTVGAGQHD